ncbi:MAG: GNAT family N-acetyltransferase [Desulfotignum sp.]
MNGIHPVLYQDPVHCRKLWESLWPPRVLFDLWPVRWCFHKAFARPLAFHVAEQAGRPVGLLALCRNDEAGTYVQFPGETWQGRTWLEQNRIIAHTPEILETLLDAVPGPVHLRYIKYRTGMNRTGLLSPDETRYLFFPASFGFDFDTYWQSISGKTRKKLNADIRKLEAQDVRISEGTLWDMDHLFRMNLAAFGPDAYFYDSRFLHAFEILAEFLHKMGLLRMTCVHIGGRLAAVDMGALWKGTYTVMAGGTNPEFPGVAKLINRHHLKWACTQHLKYVDFLCGDFNWKQRFRLTPVPLFEICTHPLAQESGLHADHRNVRCA